ncbi:MAG: helix-turn-helix domain-containing protein [Bacteroidales bacterium]|nr:helix-turn-helix domain-containing protein [Bacteroidales bacterium]
MKNVVIDLDRYRQTKSVGLSIPFGERVAIARNNQGKTQEQLGEQIGYTQSAMSRLEIGQLRFAPEVAAATAIALNKSSLLTSYCNECPVYQAFNSLEKKRPYKPA